MKAFRVFHLLFALGVVAAYFTAEESGVIHAWAGYIVGGLLLARLGLGMTRRSGFAFRRLIPRTGAAPRGQNGLRHPAIAHALTLALVICVSGAAATGIVMDRGGTLTGNSIRAHTDDRAQEAGHDTASARLFGLIGTARADDDSDGNNGEEDEEDEGLLGEVHEAFGNLLLPLVLAHGLYLLLFRLPLAKFMLFLPRRNRA